MMSANGGGNTGDECADQHPLQGSQFYDSCVASFKCNKQFGGAR
jgi:hypothetical protein